MRILLLTVLTASGAWTQPVVTSRAVGPVVPGAEPLAVRVVAAGEGAWEAPPALYWAGVGFDVAALAGGTYMLVLGAQLLDRSNDDDAGAGAFVGAMFGPFFLILGSAVVGATGYDLIRVLRGDDPFLVRAFDPTRRVPSPAGRGGGRR